MEQPFVKNKKGRLFNNKEGLIDDLVAVADLYKIPASREYI